MSAIYASDTKVDGIWYDFDDSNLTAAVTYRGNNYFDYSEYSGSVVIPDSVTYNGTTYSVTSIGEYAFYDCSSLTSVTIPNSVTSIGEEAFWGCSSLTSITIPNSVTSIGDYAFEDCSSLTSITIPESMTSIAGGAFGGCSSLTSVTISEGVTSIGDGAFSGCSSLTSITIPEGVTSIGESAFKGCSSLTSITIPNSVTSIGESAFGNCYSLTSINVNANNPNYCSQDGVLFNKDKTTLVQYPIGNTQTEYTIPNSVTSIGNNAFDGCSSLTSVTIGESVTSIESSAFSGCSSLTSITIPNSVTSIGGSAFYGCRSLTSVTIPNSVTSIGERAFRNCSSLTSITIPNSVKSIGYAAFRDCSSLTSVTIGESVTSIGDEAFRGCSSLTSITCEATTPPTIDDTYTFGDTYTFDGVSKSIPVYVPCGCVETYKAASDWSDFTNIQELLAEYSIEVYVNDTIMGTAKVNYNTFCEGAQISATPNFGYHFVQWSDGNTDAIRTLGLTQDTILTAEFALSFSGQCGDSLYWELVDTTLHIIGKGEMYDYKSDSAPWKLLVSSIKVLTIVEDVTKLSQSFDSCSVLESIIWNAKNCADASSLETAPFYAIRSQITSFTFGENVEHIPAYLCDGMDKLTSMTIPNSVTSIGSSAFYNCSSLTSVHITDLAAWCNIDFVGYSANPLCYAHKLYLNGELVKDLVIPNSVTSIGEYAFYDCSSLTSVTIGESVTSIGSSAFYNCSSLTSVTIPNSITSIGDYAFYGCSNITSVTWNAKNCNTYNFGSQVTSFEFGNEVEVVPSSLCEGMEKLTSVTIPNSVKTIGTSAFEGCARLGKINLGTGLEEIAANAFAGCTRLYDIYVYATYPPFAEESSFANYNAYLYIPCDSKRDYTLDPVWGKFQHVECLSDEETDVENIDTSSQQQTNCQKIIRNGQLLILRDGVEYTVMGQEL